MSTRRIQTVLATTVSLALGAGATTAAVADDHRAADRVIWVSPEGHDTAAGTMTEPLATIAGARDRIRQARENEDLRDGPIRVFLREGTYEVSETIEFGPQDSGAPNRPVIYSAFGNEDVRVTGGPTIPGSAAEPVTAPAVLARLPESSREEVMQLDLGALGIDDLGDYRDYGYARGTNPAPAELFVDGRPLSVAAWPNHGEAPIGAVLDPGSNPRAGDCSNRGSAFEPTATTTTTSPGDPNADIGPFSLLAPAHGTQDVDPMSPPTFRWEPAANAETYRVQVTGNTDSDFVAPVVDERTNATELQIEPGVLDYGNNVYRWRVEAESGSSTRGQDHGNWAFRTLERDPCGNQGATFEFADPALERWAEADQMFVSGFFWWGWAHDAIRVEEIDTDARTITLASASQYSVRSGQPWSMFRVSNLLEEIDRPGEYFVDHETGVAYVYPRASLADAEVQLSLLETPLMSFVEASDIEVSGLTFESSRGMGVYIESGSDVKIAGNTFHNLGEVAVSIGQGATSPAFLGDPAPPEPASNIVGVLQGRLATHSTWDRRGGTGHEILSNDVRNTGTGGIFAGAGDRTTLTPSDIRIANNDVQNFNRLLTTQAPGIWINGVGIRVEHNLVRGAVQRAMFVNGNLHEIRMNEIYDAVQDADDVGSVGMYRDPSEFGNLYEHNFFHDNGGANDVHGTQSIFLDDGTSGQIVRGNVFVRAGSNYAVKLHGGRHNRIENNIFVDTPTAVGLLTWTVDHWKNQLNSDVFRPKLVDDLDVREPPFSTMYPTLATYIGPDGRATDQPPDSNIIADNVAVGVSSLASSDVATFGDNLVTDADPGFVDPDALNYALAPGSVVYDELPDFEPIPFEDIGLFEDRYRTSTHQEIAPFNLLAPADESVDVDATQPVPLGWEAATGAFRYRVVISETSDFSDVVYDDVTSSTTLDIAQVLRGERTYYWKVEAQIGAYSLRGEPVWNDGGAARFATAPGDPDLEIGPFSLLAPAHGTQNVDPIDPPMLQWQPAEHAEQYLVQVTENTDPEFAAPVVDERTAATELQMEAGILDLGKVYIWRVRAESGSMSRGQEHGNWAFRTLAAEAAPQEP